MFRRIRSPRQQDGKARVQLLERDKGRSQSSGSLQLNGHKRQNSDEGEEIKNFGYGDPDVLQTRSLASAVTTPSNEANPPLPPRNTKSSPYGLQHGRQGEGGSETPVYVAPADTLRKAASNSVQPPSGGSGKTQGNNSGDAYGDPHAATKIEIKQLKMHQLTMSQKRGQGGGAGGMPVMSSTNSTSGHQRTQSFGYVIETSDYSIPFNLVQANANDNKTQQNSRPGAPFKPPRVGIGMQATSDSADRIIAINPPSSTSPQPPSDRSDTNSPNSPMSNQSSEHETRQDDGNSDYAIPWDRSKIFQNIPHAKPKKPPGRRRNDDSIGHTGDDTGFYPHQGRRDDQKMRVGNNSTKEPSPPPPLVRGSHRYRSARDPMINYNTSEFSPPPPEIPIDPTRPRANRGFSERAYRREGSTSPPMGTSSGGKVQKFGNKPFTNDIDDISHHRTQSVGPHHMSGRRLPTPPRSELPPPHVRDRERVADAYNPPSQPFPLREDVARHGNSSNMPVIDTNIPLADQP